MTEFKLRAEIENNALGQSCTVSHTTGVVRIEGLDPLAYAAPMAARKVVPSAISQSGIAFIVKDF